MSLSRSKPSSYSVSGGGGGAAGSKVCLSEAVRDGLLGDAVPGLTQHVKDIQDGNLRGVFPVDGRNVTQQNSLPVVNFNVLDNPLVHRLGFGCRVWWQENELLTAVREFLGGLGSCR